MKTKTRRLSIRAKILLVTNVLVIAAICFMGYVFYMRMSESMIDMGVEQARIAARLTASQLDGDGLNQIKPGEEDTEKYKNVVEQLDSLKQDSGMAFLYTLSTDGTKAYYGVDSDTPDLRAKIGEPFEVPYEELKQVFEGTESVQHYIDDTDQGPLITAYAPVRNSQGNVCAALGSDFDASEVVKIMQQTKMKILQIGGLAIFIVLVGINLLVNSITKSIRSVNRKIYDLAHNEGDLTQTLHVRTGDEMELMADNLNVLLEYIRVIMTNIFKDSDSLDGSTNKVVRHLTRAGSHLLDISATMEEMSAGMEETTASMGQISDAVDEVYRRIAKVSTQAEKGDESACRIAEKAGQIYENADLEQKNAFDLTKEMEQSVAEKIEAAKAVEEINLLTENIIKITEQTNLLALNASIEAARAGDAGKGFAVVANEIGNLATDSEKAAVKIKEVSGAVISSVGSLAKEARRMLEFMDKTALDGYQKLIAASEDYSKDAQDIHAMMERFAEDFESLKQSMDAIKENMGAINLAVEESARGVMNVSEMSADLSESMKDIENKADLNKQIVGRLENEVGKFKLSSDKN